MGTSGVLSQLFGGGASSGSGEKGLVPRHHRQQPRRQGEKDFISKTSGFGEVSCVIGDPSVGDPARCIVRCAQQQRRGFATAVVNEACHVGGFDVCTCAGTM